jgi:DNA-binding transcriptional MocR family regulator
LNDPTQGNYQRLSFGALDAESVSEGVSRFLEAVRHWYA